MLLAWILLSGFSLTFAAADETYNILEGPSITKPDCPSKCGNLTVPYPFGIGSGCAINKWFELNCSTNALAMIEGIDKGDFPYSRVLGISDSRLRVSTLLSSNCYDGADLNYNAVSWASDLTGTPYSYSDLNKLTVISCDDTGVLKGNSTKDSSISRCDSYCTSPEDVVFGSCSGKGCCQSPLFKGQVSFITRLSSRNNHSGIMSFNPCGYIFVGESGLFVFRGVSDLSDPNVMQRVRDTVPTVLDWWIGNSTCEQVKKNSDEYACKARYSHCVDSDTGLGGYRCTCDAGYQGNPYLHSSCTDIDECLDHNLNRCEMICTNTIGSFYCSCPRWRYGDGRKDGEGCNVRRTRLPATKVALGVVFGLLAVVIALVWLYVFIKKRKLSKLRVKFFHQNGGILLQQRLSSKEGSTESTKIFTAEELQQATDNYANDRIIGRGGYGTVYKGILPNKNVVAIKKSREIDESQTEQFINELIILIQVNHRNVVKFLGCCLEAEVPMLVFEYIPNATLSDHIKHKSNWLSWENRLRIAYEAAGALSYLHSAASTPIIHRDVKSANILLDEHYTAKISDFGASRLIPLDQTKVTTMVIGTFGYLDPEYFRTSQLTEKSDVYSFGVVLLELMTGGIPVNMEMSEDQRNLTTNFINLMRENRLFEILEARVVREGSFEQLQATAELIERCLQSNREDRPTMKEVAAQLEMLRKNLWSHESVKDDAVSVVSTDLYSSSISPYESTQDFTHLHSWSSSTSEV